MGIMGLGLAKLRRFAADESGIAIILVAILLPVLIGFAVLVIDISRAENLHNDTQKAADALALAGGAELDGSADAWSRAERALQNLVTNTTRFSGATGSDVVSLPGSWNVTPATPTACRTSDRISWCFLKSLPANDSVSINSSTGIDGNGVDRTAAKATDSRFILVTVKPESFNAIFPVSFVSPGASGSFTVGSSAVAGFRRSVCDYTPVFMCNPYEDTTATGGVTLEQAATTREYRRRQILLRMNGSYFPGNFAFLAAPDGNGAQALENMLASTKPQICYAEDGVDTEPGQNSGPVEQGLNSRFGIAKNYIGTADGPASNVRMGLKDIKCNNAKTTFETDPEKGVGLERDPCQITGTCTMMGGRMGAGDWNFARYWRVNHPGRAVPAALSGTGADMPTRYEVYRYELDPDGDPATNDSIVGDASVGGETGSPACSQTPVTTVDRRILYGAILDCQALAASGMKFSGRLSDVPVRAFGSFFITEPIKDSKDIYVELVDITGKGGRGTLDNFLRDEVQLYR